MLYRVNNIYPTIQGEGCMTGVPMTILRLQGCGVGCSFCDTKETWEVDGRFEVFDPDDAFSAEGAASPHWLSLSEAQISAYIVEANYGPQWILLTGGEPADQDLRDLVDELHRRGFKVALETSGTASGFIGAALDWVCISPKIDMPGGRLLIGDAFMFADEIKHVVGREEDIAKLNNLLLRFDMLLKEGVQICLQPISQSQRATELCMEVCMKRGWRLSIQTHKYLNLA